MAPHLLQWEMIKEAKVREYIKYDFWGIAPKGSPLEEKWAGVTRFKKGFGGEEVNYVGGYDFVLSTFWHGVYNLFK